MVSVMVLKGVIIIAIEAVVIVVLILELLLLSGSECICGSECTNKVAR